MANDRRNGTSKKKLSVTLVTPPFRMAFPALLSPEDTDNGERYKVIALFPPDAKIGPIEDALYECMEDGFGTNAKEWPTGRNDVHPQDKFYEADTKKYNGFKEGWMALNLSSQDAPGVVGPDKNEVLNKREVYGGRWARAQITITWYDNKSKGVTAYLNHVQLLDHDEPFSGKGQAADAFDEYKLKNPERKAPDLDDEDDNEDEAPRRDRGSRDDDRGSRGGRDGGSRSSRREEAEEAPRSRRGRDEAKDEEEARPSRRRPRSEDDEPPRNASRRGSDRKARETSDADWN